MKQMEWMLPFPERDTEIKREQKSEVLSWTSLPQWQRWIPKLKKKGPHFFHPHETQIFHPF